MILILLEGPKNFKYNFFFMHLYGFPQAFFVSKEAPTAEWRYEKERHSVRLNVGKLHLVQGWIFPPSPLPLHTRLL
jgi:hypothetical protein